MVSDMKRTIGVLLIAAGVLAVGVLVAAGILLPWVLGSAAVVVLAGVTLVITASHSTRASGRP
jgi:uncharacterized membrane protein HdeD (DUF308 family)